jgi:hypothetical protein
MDRFEEGDAFGPVPSFIAALVEEHGESEPAPPRSLENAVPTTPLLFTQSHGTGSEAGAASGSAPPSFETVTQAPLTQTPGTGREAAAAAPPGSAQPDCGGASVTPAGLSHIVGRLLQTAGLLHGLQFVVESCGAFAAGTSLRPFPEAIGDDPAHSAAGEAPDSLTDTSEAGGVSAMVQFLSASAALADGFLPAAGVSGSGLGGLLGAPILVCTGRAMPAVVTDCMTSLATMARALTAATSDDQTDGVVLLLDRCIKEKTAATCSHAPSSAEYEDAAERRAVIIMTAAPICGGLGGYAVRWTPGTTLVVAPADLPVVLSRCLASDGFACNGSCRPDSSHDDSGTAAGGAGRGSGGTGAALARALAVQEALLVMRHMAQPLKRAGQDVGNGVRDALAMMEDGSGCVDAIASVEQQSILAEAWKHVEELGAIRTRWGQLLRTLYSLAGPGAGTPRDSAKAVPVADVSRVGIRPPCPAATSARSCVNGGMTCSPARPRGDAADTADADAAAAADLRSRVSRHPLVSILVKTLEPLRYTCVRRWKARTGEASWWLLDAEHGNSRLDVADAMAYCSSNGRTPVAAVFDIRRAEP